MLPTAKLPAYRHGAADFPADAHVGRGLEVLQIARIADVPVGNRAVAPIVNLRTAARSNVEPYRPARRRATGVVDPVARRRPVRHPILIASGRGVAIEVE